MAASQPVSKNAAKTTGQKASPYPFVNFGKLDTMVVVVHHDRASDVLSVRTTLAGNDTLTLPGEVTIRYSASNGDMAALQVRDFDRRFLLAHPALAQDWPQVQAARPTPRRVEITPFLRGLFDSIRQLLGQRQDRWVFARSVRERMNWT